MPARRGTHRRRTASKPCAAPTSILSLDWVDLAGALQRSSAPSPAAKIIQVSLDYASTTAGAWTIRACRPSTSCSPPIPMPSCPSCLKALGAWQPRARPRRRTPQRIRKRSATGFTNEHIAAPCAKRSASGRRRSRICRSPGRIAGGPFRHPLDYLGSDGGGGVGGGPGISVGAALALKGSGRLPVAVCGDGDFLMGVTALWTAAHYKIPLLFVIANNRSFFNDELHQERMARMRNRPVENSWIGQRIAEPGYRSRRHGARARRAGLRPGDLHCRSCARVSKSDCRRRRRRQSPSSTCASSPATPPP